MKVAVIALTVLTAFVMFPVSAETPEGPPLIVVPQGKLEDWHKVAIAKWALVLKDHEDVRLTISGFTEAGGAISVNLDRGCRYARLVAAEFIKSGFESDRIDLVSFGEQRPLFTPQAGEDIKWNRRVEITFQSAAKPTEISANSRKCGLR